MTELRRVLTLFALAAALGGCMIGPDYSRPQIDVPQTFHYEEQGARELADTEWWKQFGDPVLDGLIDEALARNKSVQIAAANVEAATALLTQTRSALFPQVGYQGTGGRKRLSESSATPLSTYIPNPQTAYEALLGASWEIDLWGRIRRLSESARANALATEEARRGAILSLVASVASSYLQLRSLDYQLEIAQRTLAAYAESVRLFDLQFKYGQISQITVEQSRSQYETAAAVIPQIERDIVLTENAISILLGRNPGTVERGKALTELALPGVPAGVPSQLLERRPDIAQAEQQLIAANAQIGAARAQYFPAISLTGAFGSASRQLSDLFSGPARAWSYAGTIAGPIFTGGFISGQVAQAEAGQKAALYNYEAVIQGAFADVENALVSREKIAQQVDAEARRVKALAEYERLAQLKYDGGYTDYLTVLNAQQQLFPAEINYAQDLGQKYNALINIYKSMGGGWVDRADALAPQPVSGSSLFAAPIPRAETADSSSRSPAIAP
jgi:multidrug efflux system outer membrane protein